MNPTPEQPQLPTGEQPAERPRWQRPQLYRRARTSPGSGSINYVPEGQVTEAYGTGAGS